MYLPEGQQRGYLVVGVRGVQLGLEDVGVQSEQRAHKRWPTAGRGIGAARNDTSLM